MINRKRLFVSATFLSLAVFLITGCQQQGSGIKKIKDITVSKEDQEAIDERVKDLKQIEEDRIGSVDFGGGVVISLQVPEILIQAMTIRSIAISEHITLIIRYMI